MAEALLRDRLDDAGVAAAVTSAGVMSDGVPASAHGVTVMGRRGLDLGRHRSRTVAPEMLERADLIIGMARRHVREAALIDGSCVPRAFTLKEIVRRAEARGARTSSESLAAWLTRIGADRRTDELVGESAQDDVADPIGRPLEAYEQTAAELDDLLGRLVALAWPEAQRRTA
jgi:protein-tyrosine-phosphatase